MTKDVKKKKRFTKMGINLIEVYSSIEWDIK